MLHKFSSFSYLFIVLRYCCSLFSKTGVPSGSQQFAIDKAYTSI
uniref:Conotoxin n=1 Tax=Phage sp. ctgh419 TaxID=2828009 RepID=A0A8S5SM33_9VIRU|nr:MAG TPA: conotoxin [Phage sp. ctgh419]